MIKCLITRNMPLNYHNWPPCVQILSHGWRFATPRTVACQLPLSMGLFQTRILKPVAVSKSRGSSQPRDWTSISYISCIGRQIFYHFFLPDFFLPDFFLPDFLPNWASQKWKNHKKSSKIILLKENMQVY